MAGATHNGVPAFEAEKDILSAPCELVDDADLAGGQILLIHPGVEDLQIDPFEFVCPSRCHCLPFALLGYDVTTNTPDTAFRLRSMSDERDATLRDP